MGEPGPAAAPDPAPRLADPAVSLAKLDRQIALWRENEDRHRRRGLLLVRRDALDVDLLVFARTPLGPLVVASVRLNFDNYDLWAPSLVFTDPLTREPLAPGVMPSVPAWDVRETPARLLTPGPHLEHGRAFLCVPGIREYHSLAEHSGDHWLRYRGTGRGTLDVIAATLVKTIAATVQGIATQTTVVLGPNGLQSHVSLVLVQGPRPETAQPTVGDVIDVTYAASAESAGLPGARL